MTKTIPHLFANITATLEDLHGVAVEGQRRDNAPDIQQVLLFQLRIGIEALDKNMSKVAAALGGKG